MTDVMMEDGNTFLTSLVATVPKMPHIAERILRSLDPVDIANCLKTNKVFRHFIASALHCNKQLHSDLDEEVSKRTITSGRLDTSELGPLKNGLSKDVIQYLFYGFGLNDSLWLSFPTKLQSLSLEEGGLVSHDLAVWKLKKNDNAVKPEVITYQTPDPFLRPKIKILSGSRVLIQDIKTVLLLEPNKEEGALTTYKASFTKNHKSFLYKSIGDYFEVDSIFSCIKLSGNVEFTFFKEDYNGCLADKVVRVKCDPKAVLERGQFVMLVVSGGIIMLDATTGSTIWKHRILLPPAHYQVILTETFCGVMYPSFVEQSVSFDVGFFKLLLLDNITGKEIYHEKCWDIYWTSLDSPSDRDNYLPKIVASGEYLLAYKWRPNINFVPHEEVFHGMLCVKVDSKKMKCQARIINTGLADALHETCVRDGMTKGKLGQPNGDRSEAASKIIDILDLFILDFTYDNIAIGEVFFRYSETTPMRRWKKTIFSVDLEKLLCIYEPSTIYAAFHFPLDQNVPSNGWKQGENGIVDTVRYYPHYQTEADGQDRLAGIVELDCSSDTWVTKLHSLRKSVRVKDPFSLSL